MPFIFFNEYYTLHNHVARHLFKTMSEIFMKSYQMEQIKKKCYIVHTRTNAHLHKGYLATAVKQLQIEGIFNKDV